MTMKDLAEALVIRMSVCQLAVLINATLACDDDQRLSDPQAESADELFNLLCELSPEAAELAQTE